MAEHAYLFVAADPDDLEHARALLAAKRNVPLAWLLAFERHDLGAGGMLVRERGAALALLASRIERGAHAARSDALWLVRGLHTHLAAQDERWLVLDASELASAWDGIEEELDDEFAKLDAWGEAEDVDEPYLFVGGSLGEDLPWLRPPSPEQERAVEDARAAFAQAGFVLVEGPRAFEEYDELVFEHARHQGARFVVRVDDEDEGTSIAVAWGARGIALGERLAGRDELDAWAMLAAHHLGELGFPSHLGASDEVRWVHCPGATAFGERMPALASHVERIPLLLTNELTARIARFQSDVRPQTPRIALDLGPSRTLVLEHVDDPAWEPHTRATIAEGGGGEVWWNTPSPALIVPPSAQHARALAWLEELPGERLVMTGWLHLAEDGRSVVPERFNRNGAAAQMLDLEEVRGTYVFVGANLVIVTAGKTRSAFRFAVPSDFDRSAPPFVSGFREAPSGERFATVLRAGARRWRFDIEGKPIG